MAGLPIIESIKGKISRLIAENGRLRVDRDDLSARNVRLKAENRELLARVATMERRISVLELRGSMTGESDSQQARVRINRLMREVDKCIALMNRQ